MREVTLSLLLGAVVALISDLPCSADDTPTASPTVTETVTVPPVPTPTVTVSPSPIASLTRTPIACVGDCDGDGRVTVDELVKGVNIAVGTLTLDDCGAFDADGNGRVTVDELVTAVNYALCGCGTACPPPPPTWTFSPSRTPTRTPTPTATPTPSGTPTRTTNPRCADISGEWSAHETGSLTCSGGGDTETVPIDESGPVTIMQTDCNATYTISTPDVSFTRSGTVDHNHVHLTGPCALGAEPGVVINTNVTTVDGTVNGDTMTLTGKCRVNGTIDGTGFSCSGNTTATLQRTAAISRAVALPATTAGRLRSASPLRNKLRAAVMAWSSP